ncbi:MAG: CPBP family intramembrane glutamic endopeptidase [Opitutales bacterium]
MGQESPLLILPLLAAAATVAMWWLDDWQRARSGTPVARPLPGATSATALAVALAATGALLLLAMETLGEYRLGLVAQQSRMTLLFGVYTLAAALVEELIFRGYLVVDNRGPAALWAGVLGASVLFALLHPFFWEWRDGGLHLHQDAKAWYSTGAILAGSVWFYTVRFWPLNPSRSLWPCIAAHVVKNLGVFAIKYAQGYVGGWW